MRYTFNKYGTRITAIVLFVSLLLSMSGCDSSIYSNYIEVEDLQLVQTFGIDRTETGMEVSISTGEGSDELPSVRLTRSGNSIISAIVSIQDYSSRNRLLFSHARFAVLGEEGAKRSLVEFLDFLARSTEPRMDIALFVVKDGSAKNLITNSGEKSYDVTASLASIERDVKRNGESYAFTCREVARSLAEYGGALVCAISGNQTDGSVISETGTVTAVPAGFGIIKDGELCGYLSKSEAASACLLMNKAGHGYMALPDGKGGIATVFFDKSGTKYTGIWDDSGVLRKIRVDVSISAGLSELENPLDISDELVRNYLSAELSDQIKETCLAVLKRSLELETDFLGLYGILRRAEPGKIANMSEPFMTALRNVEFVVNVDAEISRSFEVGQPVKTNRKDTKNAR